MKPWNIWHHYNVKLSESKENNWVLSLDVYMWPKWCRYFCGNSHSYARMQYLSHYYALESVAYVKRSVLLLLMLLWNCSESTWSMFRAVIVQEKLSLIVHGGIVKRYSEYFYPSVFMKLIFFLIKICQFHINKRTMIFKWKN